jgi:hypothetical protein
MRYSSENPFQNKTVQQGSHIHDGIPTGQPERTGEARGNLQEPSFRHHQNVMGLTPIIKEQVKGARRVSRHLPWQWETDCSASQAI